MKLVTSFLTVCTGISLAQMAPQPLQEVTHNGEQCLLDWQGVSGRTYFIQYSLDLVTWSFMPVIESGTGAPLGYGFDTDTEKMFLRLNYTDIPTTNPNSDDFDNDGISNWDEVREGGTGTNPFLEDTNGDGIRDDGLVYAAQNDPDGVGLPASLQADLLGRWDFEQLNFTPPSEYDFADKTGNGWTANAYGVLSDPEGMVSKAAKVDNGYCSIDAGILQGKSNYSVSLWVNLTKDFLSNSNNGTTMGIYGLYDYHGYVDPAGKAYLDIDSNGLRVRKVGNTEEWDLGNYTYTNHYNGVHGQTYSNETNTMRWTRPIGTSDDGKWHHIAVVRNNGQFSVYFDNQLVSSGTFVESHIQFNAFSGLVFGRYFTQAGTSAPSATQMKGKFDRISIYDKSLTAADVQNLYRQDIDSDGLWDITENKSLLWRDSDGDGIRGANESTYIVNPYKFDPPNSDHDGDGRTSITEQNDTLYPTNLFVPDTDGDLLPDGWEVANGLNPLDPTDGTETADSDQDGATNRDEYIYGSNPANGSAGDTDGDGTSDAQEIAQGSHPNDARDGGQVIPDDIKIPIELAVGDQSGSESEDYVLNVYRFDPATGKEVRYYTLRSGGHGEYKEETKAFFRKDDTYTFQIDWQSSNLANSSTPGAADGADFDYTFKVNPQIFGSTIKIDSYDPKRKRFNQNNVILASSRSDVADFLESVEPMRIVVTTVDLDIIHPATGRLADDKEDVGDGGYVAIKRTNDSPVTKMNIPKHPFFASFADVDGGHYVVWQIKFTPNNRYKIVSGSVEIDSETKLSPYVDNTFDIEGLRRSLSRGNEKIELSLLIGGEPYLLDAVLDETKFTVVEAEFDVFFRTFIPYQWVALPHPLHDIPGDGDFFFGEVAKGDHRTFDHTVAKYRTSQFGVVIPYPDLSSSGFKSIDGSKAYVPSVGITEHFDKATSLASPTAIAKHQGLDPANLLSAAALADNVLGVPLKTNWGHADTSDMHFDLHSSSTLTRAVYNVHGAASEPIVVFAASIDWDVLLHIDISNPLMPTYSMNGEQDGFPAYEVFIYSGNDNPDLLNTSHVYQWAPPLARDVLALFPGIATEPVAVPVQPIKQK